MGFCSGISDDTYKVHLSHKGLKMRDLKRVSKEMNKYVLGVPLNYPVVFERFWWSFISIEADQVSHVIRATSAYLWDMRNNLVKTFLQYPKEDTDYLLMIDADMEFPPNLVTQIELVSKSVPKPDSTIIGVPYKSKNGEKWHVYTESGEGYAWKNQWDVEGVKERGAMGTGLLAIPRKIFEDMPFPWFEGYQRESTVSEDLVFCKKAKDRGYSIYSTPALEGVVHLSVGGAM